MHLTKKGKKWYMVVYREGDRRSWIPLCEDREKAEEIARALDRRTIENSNITLGVYLQRWLNLSDFRQSTIDSYKYVIKHISEVLGDIKLRSLAAAHIEGYYHDKLLSLSRNTVLGHHRVLRSALESAVRFGYLDRNPARHVRPPRSEQYEPRLWTIEETASFLRVASRHRLWSLFLVAILTGLRRGELVGLRWENVDLRAKLIHVREVVIPTSKGLVRGVPKTKAGRRSVAIGERLAAVLESEPKVSEYVWPSRSGGPLDGHNLSGRLFPRLCREAGVPRIRFHDLRHLHFTGLVEDKVHLKIVSERAGHSSVRVTQDLYCHVSVDHQRDVAEAAERRLWAALEGR